MRRFMAALALGLVAGAARAQTPAGEQDMRAEIAELRERLARAEALLGRLAAERPAPVPTAAAAPAAAPAVPLTTVASGPAAPMPPGAPNGKCSTFTAT